MALHFAASAAEQEEEEEDGAERERRLIGFRQRRVSRFGGREATSERASAPSSRFKSDAAMASKAAAARRSYVSK